MWIAVLTGNNRRCVYCDEHQSQTLDHEDPLARSGRDIWWNLVPACDRCNRWKWAKSAAAWQAEMKLAYEHPRAGFPRAQLPLSVAKGIKDRVSQVQQEIGDMARLRWFEHHYGDEKTPRLRAGKHEYVERCVKELDGYRYLPWTYPELREGASYCTRSVCCGHRNPNARLEYITLPKEDRQRLRQAARDEGLFVGDLLARLVKAYLAEGAR
ncbi:HNH endonuclease [Kitasatospora sp. NPDC048194]|uniref:HNH endonuclease n=1 Tax=Kitasatospora sp. NPDC048194 TaxID=3364045 RepID=UPI003722120D